jgi:predicted transcriptional regulator
MEVGRIRLDGAMTKEEIADLIERVASLPAEAQAELVDSIAEIESKYGGVYHLNDDERAGIERGLRDLREGRLVSDEDMAAFWKRHGV